MKVWFVIFLIFISGISALGGFLYRRLQGRNLLLEKNLNEIREHKLEQEENHRQNKTQWEQSEEKLRSFLQLMDTLMNTIPNPIYFKDGKGFFQGCNNVFAKRVLGLTRDRIIGKRTRELSEQIPAELAAIYEHEEWKMIEKAGFHTHEAQVLCSDGQRRDFLFSLAPVLDRQGDVSGSVAVLSDLTDKNRAARDRMLKEKLEGVLETAGAVCHELNQPLQTLSGYTELIAMRLKDQETVANIQKIAVQIDRMRNITTKLHSITRYETTDYSGATKIIDIDKASE